MFKKKSMIFAIILAVVAIALVLTLALISAKKAAYIDGSSSSYNSVTAINDTAQASPAESGALGVSSAESLTSALQSDGNAKIKLDGDITLTSPINVFGSHTLDLNGKAISLTAVYSHPSSVMVVGSMQTSGDLTIIDSDVTTIHYYTLGGNGRFIFTQSQQNAVGCVYGGVICGGNGNELNNTSARYGGGVLILNGSCKINSGTIAGNSATYGGGVYVYSGSLNVSGGYVIGNYALSGGGLATSGNGQININGESTPAYIGYNVATGRGGGIYADSGNNSLTISGGTISQNSALYGGGIYSDGQIIMKGGLICSNSAQSGGAGVYLNLGSLTMSGGEVYNNSSQIGAAGVLVSDKAEITLSGAPKIYGNVTGSLSTDNSYGGKAYNLYLQGENTIKVDGEFLTGAEVWITPSSDKPITISQLDGKNYSVNCFKLDSDGSNAVIAD